jgi:hypothetical protein
MEIKRSGSQPSSKGPAEWFTGGVIIDPLFEAPNQRVFVAQASPGFLCGTSFGLGQRG